jgi:plasmid maintenance system antidote protein VapI
LAPDAERSRLSRKRKGTGTFSDQGETTNFVYKLKSANKPIHEKRIRLILARLHISPEMAIRLGKAFDTSAESWLNQQVQYDLWEAEQHAKNLKVKKLVAA